MKNKPVKAEVFINECSLQGQFQTTTEFEKAVKDIISICELIMRGRNFDFELYKGNLFLNFEAIKSEIFQKSFNQLGQDTKIKFKRLLSGKLKDWCTQRLHQTTDKYILVQNLQDVTDTSIAEVAERKLQKTQFVYLLVNFSGSHFQALHPTFRFCHSIVVLKNQTQPNIDLDCLDNKEAFEEWAQNKSDPRNFLERETHRFKKTNFIVQGQPVYIEIRTGYHWYLDNLHKTHFEVFNQQGEHLGEADEEGKLDENKRDKTKRFRY